MKLNYKRTIFVGFAFFLICAFWQAYDNTIPLILTNKFGMSQTLSGGVMTLDNVLALFMLPLFGAISDRCNHRLGRRTPFILIGTVLASIFLVILCFTDLAQLGNLKDVSKIDGPNSLATIYEAEQDAELRTPDGTKFTLKNEFTQEEFEQISSHLIYNETGVHAVWPEETAKTAAPEAAEESGKAAASEEAGEKDDAEETYPLAGRFTEQELQNVAAHKPNKAFANPHYTNYVVPARQAYAWSVTKANPAPLVFFIIILLIVLVAMAIFRSPAVALMPDVTIKPLRSKANAVINLMGSIGGIVALLLGMVFATGNAKNALMPYIWYFLVVAALMLGSLYVFRKKVDEPAFVADMKAESERYGIEDKEEDQSGDRKLSKGERSSLLLLLSSIVLWFMGYNAITSKFSVYASNVLHKDYNLTLMIAHAAAIVSYLPVGLLSSKLGRKKMILAGIAILAFSFLVASFLRESSPTWLMNAMFVTAGIGWATINVNSFPMVVEMSKGSNVGKYTGIYYTASMAAQTITPWISGFFMDKLGMTTFFPYATIFVSASFATMLFVRHGDNKPEAKHGLEALDVDD